MKLNLKQRSKKSKLIIVSSVILFAIIGTAIILQIFAASAAQIVLTSDKTSVAKDETFTVTVGITADSAGVTVGQALLNFDQNQLSYVSTDFSTSSFSDHSLDNQNGPGFVRISSFSLQPVNTTNIVIGKVTFKALASSGSIPITVKTTDSYVLDYTTGGDKNILTTANSLSITIKDTTVPPPATEPKAQIVITPSATSALKDATFDITASINNHALPIGVGGAYITYDPTKVSYVSTTYDGVSSFSTTLPDAKNSSGFVYIGRYSVENLPTANIVIGRVTFKALVGTGDATFNVDTSQSHVLSGATGAEVLDSANNAIVTLATQPTTGGDTTTTPPVVTPTTPTPTPTAPAPMPVAQGTPVKPRSPTTTKSGKPATSTDYYLNGNYVGTNQPGTEQVTIDTSKLNPGDYEVTTKTNANDGTSEETKQKFSILSSSVLTKLGLPLAAVTSVLLVVLVIFTVRFMYRKSAPFYKTIH